MDEWNDNPPMSDNSSTRGQGRSFETREWKNSARSGKRDDGFNNRRGDGYNNRRDDGYNNRRDEGYNNRRDDGFNNRRDDGNRREGRDNDNYNQSGDEPMVMYVPQQMVGKIIGRGGSKIKELQEESGARIGVSP